MVQIYYQSGPSTPHSFRSIKPTLVTKWPPLFIVSRSKEIIIVSNWNELCFSRREPANKNVMFPVADLIYSPFPCAQSVCLQSGSQGRKSVRLPCCSSWLPEDTAGATLASNFVLYKERVTCCHLSFGVRQPIEWSPNKMQKARQHCLRS